MRTFGTFMVAVVFAVAAGCGGGSSNGTSSSGRTGSTGGQCPSSSSGQTCTGEDAYNTCMMAACGAEYKACFGNNYASGNFTGGVCADWVNCMLKCPCDATATTCETNCNMSLTTAAGQPCMTCVLSLSACVETGAGAACTAPVCTPTGTATNTATNTVTLTTTSTTTTTSTGTNCAALQACCAKMADATMKTACQSAATSAGGVDSTCALILPQLQTYCP
jgi:hypothetical protein